MVCKRWNWWRSWSCKTFHAHFYSAINVKAPWKTLGHLLREAHIEQVTRMSRRWEKRRQLGPPQIYHLAKTVEPKAADGCQATLSLSQQEAESHKKNKKKNINHSEQRHLTEKVPVLLKLRLDSCTHVSSRTSWSQLYQLSRSQQRETAAVGLQPAGVFAQLMKNIAWVVLFLGCSLRPAYLNSLSSIFFHILFSCGERRLLVVCLENLFGCEFP